MDAIYAIDMFYFHVRITTHVSIKKKMYHWQSYNKTFYLQCVAMYFVHSSQAQWLRLSYQTFTLEHRCDKKDAYKIIIHSGYLKTNKKVSTDMSTMMTNDENIQK